MDKLYNAHGIRFRYPGDWELSEQEDGGDVTVTVASRETSFWTISLLDGRPDPERVLREALDTFHGEYAELDEYPAQAKIHETPCEARDLQFVQYELINSAFLRVCPAGSMTALVLYQGTDHELEHTRPILEAITQSLEWGPFEKTLP